MPSNTTKKPAVEKALHFLISAIVDGKYPASSRLPPLETLAKQAGVSTVSMWKAARHLHATGAITGYHGAHFSIASGIDLAALGKQFPQPATAGAPQPQHFVWERVAHRFKHDILNGVYKPGQKLSSLKELQQRYSVSFQTLRKSLAKLSREGLIVPHNRTYAVRDLSPRKDRGTIVFIIVAGANREIVVGSLHEEFLSLLEAECTIANKNLEILGYFARDGENFFTNARKELCNLPSGEHVFGYVMVIAEPFISKDFVLRRIAETRKPAAFLDLAGGRQHPPYLSAHLHRQFESAISPSSGSAVGRYLLGMGHCHWAYISPFHNSHWSPRRLEGLRNVLYDVNSATSIIPCTCNNPPDVFTHFRELSHRTASVNHLLAFYDSWKAPLPPAYRNRLDELFTFIIPERYLPSAEFEHTVSQLFEQALASAQVTVWIAANDEVALNALSFLKRHGIAVPERISVISFDDTHDALRYGLTSYNFNMRAYVYAMLGYVFNKQSHHNYPTTRPIEFEGMVKERLTVRRLHSTD
ncbi:MAG: GntR family transcriptional regulator [Chitinivibrionales bacterium]|nr:GntR family transcriptional regulator [Chitinivibrionales bacterium]